MVEYLCVVCVVGGLLMQQSHVFDDPCSENEYRRTSEAHTGVSEENTVVVCMYGGGLE